MYLKLAWRNLWRNRRRTLITVSSVFFAVLFALFLESLERGAHNLMVENMTGFQTGYIQVQDARFESEPSLDNSFYFDDPFAESVYGASEHIAWLIPRIETFMLASGDEITRGAMVLGIDPGAENRHNDLQSRLTAGRMMEPGDGSAVISEGLARRLDLAVGDTLVLLGQGRFGNTAAGLFEVGGLIRHPIREMNNQMVWLSLADAQWLLAAEGHITALLVTPDPPRLSGQVAEQLRATLPDEEYRVLTWQEMMPELLEALEFDQAQTRIIMGILYVVIGFGIFGTILTMTLERLKEFGILLSIGMQRVRLALVLFMESIFMGAMGVISGSAIGFLVVLWFNRNPIWLGDDMEEIFADFGFEPVLPTALAPDIFLWQAAVVFVMTLLICLYPSLKVLRMNVMEASRR